MNHDFSGALVKCTWQRLRDCAHWLITLSVPPSIHGKKGAYPQAHAVVDDFGSLVIVEWPNCERAVWL